MDGIVLEKRGRKREAKVVGNAEEKHLAKCPA